MSFGVTSQGFNRMLESDIVAALRADLAPLFGVDPATTSWPTADSPLAQLLNPFARQAGIFWEQVEAIYQGGDPNQAAGTLLDLLLSLNNLTREEATATAVLAALSGTEGTVVPAGKQLVVVPSGAVFGAAADATITKAVLLRADVVVSTVATTGTQYQVVVDGNTILSGVISGSPTVDSIAFQLLKAVNAASVLAGLAEAAFAGSAVIKVVTVANVTVYTVTLDGVAFTYTSDSSATATEIRDGLIALINAGGEPLIAVAVASDTFSLTPAVAGTDWVLGLTANLGVNSLTPAGGFSIKSDDLKTAFSLTVDTRMAISKLFSPQTYLALSTGPVEAPAGTLTTIQTPTTGLTAATNFLDGVLGQDVETDDAARVRRSQTNPTGTGPVPAILSRLRRASIAGVTTLKIYENIGDNPDSDGRPGHTVELLVVGGKDVDIATTLWASRDAGVAPYGNINADGTVVGSGQGSGITIKDSNGLNQVVHFSRPVPKYAWVTAILTYSTEETFPADGLQAVKDNVVALGLKLVAGQDFLFQRFVAPCVSVPGVARVDLRIGVSDDASTPPTGFPSTPNAATWQVDIAISPRQVLVFDTSRVSVT